MSDRRALPMASDGALRSLPILVLMPHSRCNCRCVMCDIWQGNDAARELTRGDLERHAEALRALRVHWVVLSGGEALLHGNLWSLCEFLREAGVGAISLLSTGLLLSRHAADVVRHCDEVIVSLDGSREVHDAIRRVPRAFDRMARGITAVRAVRGDFPISARAVVQRQNFRDLDGLIRAARDIGIDRLSFLAADVSSTAFNRPDPWDGERRAEVALSAGEAAELEGIVEEVIAGHREAFESERISSSPDKLRSIAAYYAALAGRGRFPAIRCNAPWVSAVIEADGAVRPCFFLDSYGNLRDRPLDQLVGGPEAAAFRAALDPASDPRCARCVCTLHLDDPAALAQRAP